MAVRTNAVTVTTTRTKITTADSDGTFGHSCIPYNDGTVVFYTGGDDVTASGAKKGVPCLPGSFGMSYNDLGPGEDVYAITASGSSTCTSTEQGVS
jgi:hypothetical protein